MENINNLCFFQLILNSDSCLYNKNYDSYEISQNVLKCLKKTLQIHTNNNVGFNIPLEYFNISVYRKYIESYPSLNSDNNHDILENILCIFQNEFITSNPVKDFKIKLKELLNFITNKIKKHSELSSTNIQPQFLCIVKILDNINSVDFTV